jgi:4-hydroxybenzoate polyprenyltransferase
LYFAGVAFAAAHLCWQIARLNINDAALCLRIFKSNRDFGAIVFASILIGKIF